MLKNTLAKALHYYDHFDYLTIANKDGVIEYASIFQKDSNSYVNQNTVGMYILDMYPGLTEKSSTLLQAIRTGKEIHNTMQELKFLDNNMCFLLSSDFPIISNGDVVGVVEVSVQLSSEVYTRYLGGSYIVNKKKSLYSFDDIITQDDDFLGLIEIAKRVSNTDSPVLIIGETGTGKDMIAQALHNNSFRLDQPFVAQNCAAIPSSLLESTFFGTVKGAYTGSENTVGLFELAKDGTLFLDEINSMDIGLQAKILRAIEEKVIRKVGGTKNIETNIRIVSAMNITPQEAIGKGLLRQDLYYRLGVVQLRLPSLAERKGDIIPLLNHFINKYNIVMHKEITGPSEEVVEIFNKYSWHGNVRELQNVVESAFNVTRGNIITEKDIPDYLKAKVNSDVVEEISFLENPFFENLSLEEKMKHLEKEIISKELNRCKTLAEAARKLGVSPQTLQYKLKKLDLAISKDNNTL